MSEKPKNYAVVCEHGGLKRKCYICELLAEIEQLKAERDDWKERTKRAEIKTWEKEDEIVQLKAENERLIASRAAIADEQVVLRKELDEAERHWDKEFRRAKQLKAERDVLKAEQKESAQRFLVLWSKYWDLKNKQPEEQGDE